MTAGRNDKRWYRSRAAARSAELTAEYMESAGRSIQAKLLSDPEYLAASTVMLYMNTARELSTGLLIEDCLTRGVRLCLPLCTDRTEHRMEAIEIRDLSELEPGSYGIMEPARWTGAEPDPRVVRPEDIDYVVCPCVACDRQRNRLGHGAGYYDRWLASFRGKKVALCPERLLMDDIPVDDNDIRMDEIITERE